LLLPAVIVLVAWNRVSGQSYASFDGQTLVPVCSSPAALFKLATPNSFVLPSLLVKQIGSRVALREAFLPMSQSAWRAWVEIENDWLVEPANRELFGAASLGDFRSAGVSSAKSRQWYFATKNCFREAAPASTSTSRHCAVGQIKSHGTKAMAVIEYTCHFVVRIGITLEAVFPSTRTHSGVKTIPIGESQLYLGCLIGERIPPTMIEIMCLFPHTRLPSPLPIPRDVLDPVPSKRHR
jgi:hypothetical protein